MNSPTVLVQLRRRARETSRTVDETIQYYAMERFLYRLGMSNHRDGFVLKGAMMLRAWDTRSARSTRDIDLLAFVPGGLESVRQILAEVCRVECVEDQITFDADTIRMELIKEFDDYQGARAKFLAHLGTAKVFMQLDLGFGDKVYPSAVWADFPTILDQPAPKVRMYSRASVVAEKMHAMAKLGMINSRMKDYYDIWFLSMQSVFESDELAGAIATTFQARKTPVPSALDGLSDEYVLAHESMWKNFMRNGPMLCKQDLGGVVVVLKSFLEPFLNNNREALPARLKWYPDKTAWIPATE